MRSRIPLLAVALLLVFASNAFAEDPYLWLEEVEGEKALEWVEERSAQDTAELEAVPEFAAIHEKLSRSTTPRPDSLRGDQRRLGLQLLAGRRARARHLAPHHPRRAT